MNRTNPSHLSANRMRPASYDKKELIDFTKPLRWMNGVEQSTHPSNGLLKMVLAVFAIAIVVTVLRISGVWI